MTLPTIGVLAVQGDVREHAAALARCGSHSVLVRRPTELGALDGLVIPGGESTVMDKLVRAFGLQESLREVISRGTPVYGSCAGMIMLAEEVLDGRPDQETLGGLDVVVRRNAFGRQVDSFEADLTVAGIDRPEDPLSAVFIRAPWVESVGPQVEILAEVDTGPGERRAVAVRQGNLLATSFHPEIGGDDRVHAAFVAMVRDR
ncbi:5'-phosphate synthase pdxT subunit [Austwickia chelonae]|uniref:Pyridoxal 5'-phosphate synthase subunit PdxT n=1 Tax=Austwickia chelonae NBRC 105200 TaxID=1184607 RepID=K6V5N3_9MICO|nr:pyridoxal 5'-phosphate synthase glutaminase subunit PdxT [Austwickia chelonae]GAB77503.1 glutamine amidotransferase subunit PdxT [Austwickia chelonae NBRC 105200]SEW11671.1 5'-phosphate synthase pdxT subunit [Austwickia chelonae]